MKITVQKSDIGPALNFVRSMVREVDERQVLKSLLLRASKDKLSISAHSLDRCATASCAAKVYAAGELLVSREIFGNIVSSASDKNPVNITVSGDRAMITQGRSRYPVPTLSDIEFPALLVSSGPKVKMDKAAVETLFSRPLSVVNAHEARALYMGLFLHERDGMLASVGSDGTRIMSCRSEIPWAFEPVMVSRDVAGIIGKMGDGMFSWSDRIIEIDYPNGTFASTLLREKFPDYTQIAPTGHQVLEFNLPEFAGAMARLAAVGNHGSVVALAWESDPKECRIEYQRNGEGVEVVACGGNVQAGRLGFPPVRFSDLLNTLRGQTLSIYLSSPGRPVRLVDHSEPETILIQAPAAIFDRVTA